MKTIARLTAGLLVVGGLGAEELPALDDKPWLACFMGHEGRGFDFGLGADGESEIHFKKGTTRISPFLAFKVRYFLEEEVGGKWVRRQIVVDGFETAQKPSDEPVKVTFTATYTGDTKVEVTHEFDKEEVVIGTKIVAKTTTNPLRHGVEVVVPDLYRQVEEDKLSERELKDKVEDAEVQGETLEGKRLKEDLHELPKLAGPEFFEEGAKVFAITSSQIADRELTIDTVEEGCGRIEIRQKKAALHGFEILWMPDPAKAGTPGARVRLKVK